MNKNNDKSKLIIIYCVALTLGVCSIIAMIMQNVWIALLSFLALILYSKKHSRDSEIIIADFRNEKNKPKAFLLSAIIKCVPYIVGILLGVLLFYTW
ncbi:MAG: hypothetical protein IJ535_07365 [Pseudobutyrivibrio sp.]|uniref:hypothetical protein n=1 Tax=Pseudobutyrivibrio sp. TaxID=2014367 RepID=UPI0025D65EE7|nr:hypothetical protein [Pseudobutyrivibrio sp.]MBQ8489587.1 hypothetical protein [Pseudobutyrivibrio sp.]